MGAPSVPAGTMPPASAAATARSRVNRTRRGRPAVAAGLLAVALLLGALAPGAPVAPVAAASCPDLPVTLRDLMRLDRTPGPLETVFPPAVGWVNEAAAACYGKRVLRLRVFVNQPEGIGGASAFGIRPRWLASPGLIVYATARQTADGYGRGRFYGLYVPPRLGDVADRYDGHWVDITARFHDPRARTCRMTGPEGMEPTVAQARRLCAAELVLLTIRTADRTLDAPATDTDPAADDGPAMSGGTAFRSPGGWAGRLARLAL